MAKGKKTEDGEWAKVEKSMQEVVNKRRLKVQKLEQELDAYRKHYAKLLESFSTPTFPEGCDPVSGRLLDYGIPFVPPADRGLNQSQPPSTRISDGGDVIEEAGPLHNARKLIQAKHRAKKLNESSISLSLKPSGSTRESPRKSAAKHDTIPVRVSEKIPSEGSGDTGDSDSSDEGSSSASSDDEDESLVKSSAEESPCASSDEDESLVKSSAEESPDESSADSESLLESSDEESSGASSDKEISSGKEPSGNEDLASASESDSDEPEADVGIDKKKPSDIDPEEISVQEAFPSSGSDSLREKMSTPAKTKGENVKNTRQSTTKASASRSESEDSDESSSSSDEDSGRNTRRAQTGRAPSGRVSEPAAPKAVALSPDASPEELFDWIVLGLQGPWLPPELAEIVPGASELKDKSLPLKFPGLATYTSTFQKLIGEEAKAILLSEWEKFKAEQDTNTQRSHDLDSRGQSLVWHLRSMVGTTGDAFHYFEAECRQGNTKFDVGEFLCMIVPKTEEVKGVALVYNQERNHAPLLRTRLPRDFSLDECILLRLYNMVTLRRMFLAVTNLSSIFSPFQQQVLDPLANARFMKPLPSVEDLAGDDSKLNLSSDSLRNFRDRKILNPLQLLAVSSLLQMRHGFQLVQGPPGTGKTSTIVGMVSTLLIEEPGARILVCAPSNAALDEMAARLMHGMLDKSGNVYSPMDGSIVRFGSYRAIHPIVQVISLDSLTQRLSGSGRPRAWADILDGASVVCATLSGCGSHTFDELEKMFDIVIIDEAAQAVEAEVLIALRRARGRCVMVGDPQQLPATVFQRPSVAYGRSLFERFQVGGNHAHLLTTQYRMHPSICMYPSKQFYAGALINAPRTTSMQSIFKEDVCERGITVRGCRLRLGHYCFMDVGWGTEREELVGHSRANYEEALVVCNVVEAAVKGLLPGRKPNVGVITPYIAQRNDIEAQLGRRGIDSAACEVNTVDGFQGREKDVIVLSCVRAMADQGLGFVSDEKRMNVALTRAKFSLIIVGHAKTLRKWSPVWDALIEDARQRGCFQDLSNKKNPKNFNSNREVGNTPQNSMNGSLPNKKEHKSMTTDTKKNKDVNHKENSGEASKAHEHTQEPVIGDLKAKLTSKSSAKRKRKALEADGGNRNSEAAPNADTENKASEDLQVPSAADNEVNSSDLLVAHKKKKKRKKQVKSPEVRVGFDAAEPSAKSPPVSEAIAVKVEPRDGEPCRTPILGKRTVKVEPEDSEASVPMITPVFGTTVKVELQEGEPSVTKTPPVKVGVANQVSSSVQKRRKLMPVVICLPAPALTPPSTKKGRPPPMPPSATKSPLEAVSAVNEEVTCLAPPGFRNTGRTSVDDDAKDSGETLDDDIKDSGETLDDDIKDSGKTLDDDIKDSGKTLDDDIKDSGKTLDDDAKDSGKSLDDDAKDSGKAREQSAPAAPNPRGTNKWKRGGGSNRGWHDGHRRQSSVRSLHASMDADPNRGYGNLTGRLMHWGNSYGAAAPGPQSRFHAHESNTNPDLNIYSALARPHNHLQMQPNHHGVPENHWQQHLNVAHVPPHGHPQFPNFDHRQPHPIHQREPHSALRRMSDPAAIPPRWNPRRGRP